MRILSCENDSDWFDFVIQTRLLWRWDLTSSLTLLPAATTILPNGITLLQVFNLSFPSRFSQLNATETKNLSRVEREHVKYICYIVTGLDWSTSSVGDLYCRWEIKDWIEETSRGFLEWGINLFQTLNTSRGRRFAIYNYYVEFS